MKLKYSKYPGLLLLLWLLASAHLLAATKDENDKLQDIIKELRHSNLELKNQRSIKSENEEKLRLTEILLGQIRRDLRQSRSELNQLGKEIAKLEAEKKTLEQKLELQKSALRQDMINSYSTGRQEYFKVLLNQEDPAKLSRLITYYNYFHKARSARISSFHNSMQALESLNDELQLRHSSVSALQARLTQKQLEIKQEQAVKNRVIENLNKEIVSRQEKISRLKSARNELEKIINRVSGIMSDIGSKLGSSSFVAKKGKFLLPSKGKIVSKYRSKRAGGKLRSNGIIIGASQGSSVFSIHHGRVVFSDWLRGFGLLTIIDHGEGYMTLYGHNESLLKETGDWVSSGDLIATAGNSGGHDKTGLYFEIRKKGKPTNPLSWCKSH